MKIGKMGAGSRPKSKAYRVISESVENVAPPPEYVEKYWIEVVATGKRVGKHYLSLEEAELACKEMNNIQREPD